MLSRNTGLVPDSVTREMFNHVLDEGLGNAILLSAAPTATAPLLSANEWGVYGGKLYFRIAQTIYEVTPSATITIT